MEGNALVWTLILVAACVGFYLLSGKKRDMPSSFGGRVAGGLTVDVTEMAREGKLDAFAGREAEIERSIHILLRRNKNNPLLIGEPGVGKTAIVHGLAQRIVSGNVPDMLKGKRLLALDLPALMSETKYRGELEKRLQRLLKELEGDARQNILFIDEIHMLIQAGGTEGALNIADAFKPALASGDLQVIGATTWDEYQQYIRPNAALDRRLQPVLVDEPSPAQTLNILKSLRPAYEAFHKVKIPDDALKAAVDLSDKKIKGRFLPDKAIDLIDEAAAKVSVDCSQARHGTALGVVHAAASARGGSGSAGKHAKDVVTVEDIKDVVDQWSDWNPNPA